MTETSTDAGADRVDAGRAGLGTGAGVDVRSLDDQSVLDAMRSARRVADRAEAGLLRFAVHYVDLHPITDEHPGATPGSGDRCLQDGPATTDRTTGGAGLGGPGTPGIAEYAVEALGAHLSLSYRATYELLVAAVELSYRLPRLWDLVQGGRLQAWKARLVTAHTRSVSADAAGFVDRHLRCDAARNRVPTLSRLRALTHEALLQCDPDTAQGHLTVRPVLHQRCGHSETGTVTHPRIRSAATATTARGPERNVRTDPCCAPVDRHDPPSAMREAVILRAGHCVFPGCTTDARFCDLDHVIAYLDPDDGGPPGQTSLENLGCLCRRHHRLKTFTAWTYRRLPDGDYEWISPTGRVYLAAPTPKTAPHPP